MNLEYVEELPPVPARPKDGHKGIFGKALLIGGSRGMVGACSLAAQAALHAGAGLVSVCVPNCILDSVAQFHPAYMSISGDCDGRCFSAAAIPGILEVAQDMSAIGLGPGMGQTADVRLVAQRVYADLARPLVLDADGLNALSAGTREHADGPGRRLYAEHAGLRILTPHPGEFGRMTGLATHEVAADRARLAADFARNADAILVLKGHRTVVTDGTRVYINRTGSTALATGGSGDVLTGVITALLARGMQPFSAAQLGVYLHGLAGEAAARDYGEEYCTAVEILRSLCGAWKHAKKLA